MLLTRIVVAASLLAVAVPAAAQRNDRLRDMDAIASALGVSCSYCHGAGRESPPPVTASGKTRRQVASEMIAMTEALNATVQGATGKPANETVSVQCVTCHRGVPIPRQLSDILWQTTLQKGAAAAVAQYRELREQFHGRGTYDFGENTLLLVARGIGQARPEDAIALMQLNLEFHPRSSRSYNLLATAQSRGDLPAAVATLKKALEVDPNNAEARGRLFQLEDMLARRERLGR